MNIKHITGLILCIFIIADAGHAEEKKAPPTNIGIYGALNYNMHNPSFTLGNYNYEKSGNSLGFAFGAIGNFPINETYVISGRLGYNDVGGEFDGLLPGGDNSPTLKAALSYLEISPVVQFHNLVPLEKLYFLAGLEFGFPIIRQFDTSGVRKDIPDAAPRFAIIAGAGYTFDLSENIFLSPELSFRFPFTEVSTNDAFNSWKVPQIRLGVNLTFGFTKKEEPPRMHSELHVGETEVRYYDREGNHYPLKRIKVEDLQYKELFPLIPYVFFDEDQAVPPEKYQDISESGEAGEGVVKNLEPDAISINKETLDIIGNRMKDNPDATITINGTRDSKTEAKNSELSLRRAEFAKRYLMENFGIDANRIKVTAGGLPSKPSSSRVPDGVAENRRIEFSSDDPAILQPIIIKEKTQSISEPNLIEFVPDVSSTDSITAWTFEISQAGKELRKYKGTGKIKPIQWVIFPDELRDSEIPLEYYLQVKSESGLEREETGTIPIEYYSIVRKKEEKLPDKTISKFSLILFDFDKADISDSDMRVIETDVVPEIKYNSTVKIYGYTDRIGDEDYNQKLAERRAEAVKDVLQNNVKDAKFEVYGVGYNKGLFDNNSPIGRQLSRTVQIFVETPR